jgi:hypothetical protein
MLFTRRIKKEMFFEILLFSAAVASISLFFQNSFVLAIVLFGLWLTGFVFWHKRHDAVFFATGAIVGSIAEIICVNYGAWQYANPSFLRIPLWLPFAWGLASVLVIRIAETFVSIKLK